MKITHALLTFSVSAILLLTSCKKDILESIGSKPTVTPKPTDTTVIVKPITYNRNIAVGTGSGDLTIDGKTMNLQCNDLISIKGGQYNTINVKNILSATGCPITIKNNGLVELKGNFHYLSVYNVNNVTISGDGTTGIAKGFAFSDNSYRAVDLSGSINNFTIQHMTFRNIADADITFRKVDKYTGAEDSYSQNIKILNMTCDNTAVFLNGGGYIDNGNVLGYVKNIEIAYLDFRNSPGVGTVVYMGNVENYNVHHNRIDNINTQNDNHNGIFALSGNGSFHHNYVSNHQGNAIRAFGFSVGTQPKDILIYDNIVVNSRKYSGFEVQGFATSMAAGKTTYTNAVVFNNTCGNINISNQWQGNLVDVYSLQGGKCDVYNNLGYNFQGSNKIAGQQSNLIPNEFSNLYYASRSAAGVADETTFKLTSNSPAKGKGVATPFVITDYHGSVRATKPSIGAVE
jgi:hypothetical protein